MSLQVTFIDLEELSRRWRWFLMRGTAMVLVGLSACVWAIMGAQSSLTFSGGLLLAVGILEILDAFWAERVSSFLQKVQDGILNAVVGTLIVLSLLSNLAGIHLLLTAFFMVGGLLRIIVSATLRVPRWTSAMAGGIASLVFGVLVWMQWPSSEAWFLGLCVSLDIIFRGSAQVILALALRQLRVASA